MGSIQQVAMAAVCLAAAFAFGSFINQAPDQQANQSVVQSPDRLGSLIDSDVTVQKSPARTPWMKPRLSARLPMPSLPNDSSLAGETANTFGLRSSNTVEIPPPSDLTGRIGVPTNSSSPPLIRTQPTTMVSDAPTFGSDFGESSMPTVSRENFSISPNLADSMRAPSQPDFDARPQPTVEDAPVFSVTEYTDAETLPAARNLQAETYVASKPRLLTHSMSPIESGPERSNRTMADRPTTIKAPEMPFENAISNQRNPFRRRLDAAADQTNRTSVNQNAVDQNTVNQNDGLMPIPSLNQTVRITDPGGAFGNRDSQLEWGNANSQTTGNESDYYPEANRQQATQQQRVARLPLQLNSNAKSKLTRLRDNTIQKISLSTTQFSEHVVERGDSLQSIASKYFGKPDFYLDIYLANRDRLRYPGDISEGMTIKIPVYE